MIATSQSPTSAPIITDIETGSFVDFYQRFLNASHADNLFDLLSLHVMPFMTQDKGKMFGKEWTSKRLVGTLSTARGVNYSYSKIQRLTMNLTISDLPWLNNLREQLEQLCGHELNFVFLNFYRASTEDHPDDQLGWHSDDDDEMSPDSQIVSVSVGDTRTFAFRKSGETKQLCSIPLAHGDVVIEDRLRNIINMQ